MDNASNNDTMMKELSSLLSSEREIVFNAIDRRVMCYAHVIDLASGRVIKHSEQSDKNGRDPINLGRNVVRVIRASGTRRDSFNAVIENGNRKRLFKQGDPPHIVTLKMLELLRSVPTRWDSAYTMLKRLRELQPVLPSFF